MPTFQLRANELSGLTGLSVQLYPPGGAIANPGGDALSESSGLFTATIAEALSGRHDYYVYQSGSPIYGGFVYCGGSTWIADQPSSVSSGGGVDPGDIPPPTTPGICTVRFRVIDSSGTPIQGCYVNVWLEDGNSLVDNAMVSRAPVNVRTNSSGYVDVGMIQLEQFKRGGTYVIQISDPSGRRLREARVRVPLFDTCYADDLTEI